MNQINSFAPLFWGLILICGLSWGCNQDPCMSDDVDCGEFGNCVSVEDDALCLCTSGYEKDSDDRCTVKQVEKFVGTWRARDIRVVNGQNASEVYDVVIEESPSSITSVLISNFAKLELTDNGGNVLCEPIVLGTIGGTVINIQDIGDGLSYCDAQGQSLNFSGYRFQDAFGEFNNTQDTLFIEYRLTYTLDDEQGNPVTTEISSQTALFKP